MDLPVNVTQWWNLVDKWCVQLGVSQSLILAMIHQESGGNPSAKRHEPAYQKAYIDSNAKWLGICKDLGISPAETATSYGLMQLMFPTAYGYGCRSINQALDPDQNIRFGTAHVAALMKKYSREEALAAYNGGEGAVKAYREGANTAAVRYSRSVMALYNRYRDEALKKKEKPETPVERLSVPIYSYFMPEEFACKCGCKLTKTTPGLLKTVNTIRHALNAPLIISSGTRCENHNTKVGGVANSNHMTGDAADIVCPKHSPADVQALILNLWNAGELLYLAGLGSYSTFTHVDVAPVVKGRLRTWKG